MHIVNFKVGLYDIKNICKPVKIGEGKLVYATKVGWRKVSYMNQEGENTEYILESVQYIPGFWINLSSLTVPMSKGCMITNEGRMFVTVKDTLKLKFNEEIKQRMVSYAV